MNAASDHMLEYALGRVLGRSDTELVGRILERCQRGRPAACEPHPLPSRRRFGLLVAVALPIAVAAMWMWPSTPAAVADLQVLAARDADWPPLPRSSFQNGDLLVVDGAVQIRLADTGTVAARPGTVLRVEDAGAITLFFGSVQATSGDAQLRVATTAGTIGLAPGASAEIAAINNDYALEPGLSTLELGRRIHMLDTTLVISLAVTLLQGAGELQTHGEVRALQPGVAVRQDTERDEVRLAQLRKEIGTWTVIARVGGQEFTGVEVCRRGSGDHSIVSDIAVTVGERRMETTVLISYDPQRRRYSGTYVDNFGGELGLLLGPASSDPKQRVLQMNKFHGGEFGIRMRTQWVGEDERRTVLEDLRDGEWQTRREMTHLRQPEPPSDLFQVILNVRDMQTQVEFYRDVLGLDVVGARGVTDFSGTDRVLLSTGQTSLALHRGRESENSGDEARLSFRVNDLEAASDRVRQAGLTVGEVRRPAPGVRVVDCRDPEGNRFHLEEHPGR